MTRTGDNLKERRGRHRLTLAAGAVVAALAFTGSGPAAGQPPQLNDIAGRYEGKPRLMFTAVPVSNVEQATRFYRDVTGAVVKRERRRSDLAEIFMGYPNDPKLAPTIMLVWRDGAAHAHRPRANLAFETPDAAAAVHRALAAGGGVVRAPKRLEGAPLIIAVVQDPDGNHVELVQYAPTGSSRSGAALGRP